MAKKFYYIDAVTPSVATRILTYIFQDSFDRLEKNDEKRTYDVFLVKPKAQDDSAEAETKAMQDLEYLKDDIQDFQDYWGKGYQFFFSANK
jgi:hypothetical protein